MNLKALARRLYWKISKGPAYSIEFKCMHCGTRVAVDNLRTKDIVHWIDLVHKSFSYIHKECENPDVQSDVRDIDG